VIHHITRATRHLIFWSLIATALGLTGVRVLFSGIEDYKSNLASLIGEQLGAPVSIGRLRAKMRGFNPELILSDIDISSTAPNEQPAIQLNEIRFGVNIFDMLVRRELLSSSWVTVVGAKLTITQKPDGSFAIVGLKARDGQPLWLMQGGKFELLKSTISWQNGQINSLPSRFDEVDLAIINDKDSDHHRINMVLKLPKKLGKAMTVAMDFNGNVFEPNSLKGRIFAQGSQISLRELATADFPIAVALTSGTADFKIWADWQQAQLIAISGSAKLQNLHFNRKDKASFPVKQLQTQFQWAANDREWRLDIKDFLLETAASSQKPGKKWPSALFSIAGETGDINQQHKIALFVERLDLNEASDILQFFAPLADEQSKMLADTRLKGRLEHFLLFADLDKKQFAVNGRFAALGLASSPAFPGLENLAGHIKGNEQQGTVWLMTKNAALSMPELFRSTLAISELKGPVAWQQTDTDWLLSSSLIHLATADFKTQSRLHVSLPKAGGEPFLDIQSSFAADDASKTSRYLPTGALSADVTDWLDHAFVKGRVSAGRMLFYGKPGDFPFTHGEGVFEALFHADAMELNYHPEWPHLTGLAGDVLFLPDSLQVKIQQGKAGNVTLKQVEVSNPSLENSNYVLVKGELGGEIIQALNFMQHTPLNSPVNSLLNVITPEGDTRIALDLKIPLTEGVPAQVEGTAQLSNARLTVKPLDLQVNRITGPLKFNELGVYSDGIEAVTLGDAIQIAIKTTREMTNVTVSGHAGVNDLKAQFKLPWWDRAEGVADYQLQLNLPFDERTPELLVQSDLTGITLNLPGALAKAPQQSRPLRLKFAFTDQALLPLELNYDNQLKAAIKFNTQQQSLYSGHILVGTGEVRQTEVAGLKLEINRDPLALQDWLGLSVAGTAEDGSSALDNIREISIHSKRALWQKADMGKIDLDLIRAGNYWTGNLSSAFAQGKVQLPSNLKGPERITLAMDVLDISTFKQLRAEGPTLSPGRLPLFNISSQKTLWHNVDLGQLTMETERIAEGIRFKRVELSGANEKLSFTGDWKAGGETSQTLTKGRLESAHFGRLLSKLGISDDMTETHAVLDFSLNWNGSPHQFSITGLQGQVDVNLKKGRILSIEPGFGRVLGMLAMAQWLKRIQFDFSDVYEEGLTFNSIKGRFDLLNGVALTQNLIVDAIPAKITLTGDTNLVKHTVDHHVHVVPKSSDAVPIAGTIMGKIAALVARSLTGEEQEGFFFGSEYRVLGDWGSAQIIPLHENDGLLQKTWSGITGFPWLKQPKNNNEER